MDQLLKRVPEADKEAFVSDIRNANTFEEKLLILEKYNITLTDEEKEAWKNNPGNEVSDEELDMASGGCCGSCKGCSCGGCNHY